MYQSILVYSFAVKLEMTVCRNCELMVYIVVSMNIIFIYYISIYRESFGLLTIYGGENSLQLNIGVELVIGGNINLKIAFARIYKIAVFCVYL